MTKIMTTTRKRITVGLVALVVGIFFLSATVYATTYTLTNSNIIELAGIQATVTTGSVAYGVNGCTTVGGCTTLSVELTANPTILTPIGISEFTYNSSASPPVAALGVTGNTQTWTFDASTAGFQADGFGKFTNDNKTMGQETGGVSVALGGSGPLIFTIPDSPTFVGNDGSHNAMFAVFVKFSKLEKGSLVNCSGWVSDGTTTSTKSDPYCAATTVPQPGTLALVGAGFVGLGFLGRRRLLNGIKH